MLYVTSNIQYSAHKYFFAQHISSGWDIVDPIRKIWANVWRGIGVNTIMMILWTKVKQHIPASPRVKQTKMVLTRTRFLTAYHIGTNAHHQNTAVRCARGIQANSAICTGPSHAWPYSEQNRKSNMSPHTTRGASVYQHRQSPLTQMIDRPPSAYLITMVQPPIPFRLP